MQDIMAKEKGLPFKNPFKKSGKRILIAVICLLIAAGAAGGVFAWNKAKAASASSSIVYREYKVQEGDITVGTEESGTVTVERSLATFPINATVEEVYVKIGQEVTAGTPLVKISLDSISETLSDYETKIAQAKTSLEKAKYEQTVGLKNAKNEYDSAVGLNSSATVENEISKSQLDQDIASAQAEVDSLKEQLAKYTALQQTDDSDQATLDYLKAKVKEFTNTVNSLKEELSDYTEETSEDFSEYKSIYNTYTSAKKSLTSAQKQLEYLQKNGKDTTAAQEAVDKAQMNYKIAKDDWEDVEDDYDEINDTIESYNEKIDKYTKQLEEATEEYNDFNETFKEKYSVSGDELDEKVKSLTQQLQTAQYNLEKKQKSYSSDVQSADEKLASNLTEASNAKTKYDYTVNSLAAAVQTAQESYDTLVKEYEEIKSNISSDGVVSAKCDGVVAAVNYEAGSSYQAKQTLVSIADKRYISLSLSVSEEDVTSISVGQKAKVSLTAYEGQTFDATVDSIAYEPARSSSAVTYTVTVKLDDESGTLNVYEGMSGEVTIIKKQVEDVLYVSNKAITYAGGKSSVLVKNSDGTQSTVEVETGFSDGKYVEIKSGLNRGDTVLVESAVSSK